MEITASLYADMPHIMPFVIARKRKSISFGSFTATLNLESSQPANTAIYIETKDGKDIITFL